MLCGLSATPTPAEWRCARQVWGALMTFKQERRGRPNGPALYPTRGRFVGKLTKAFDRLYGAGRNLADYSETAFVRDWFGGSYEAYKKARDTYSFTFSSIVAAFARYREKRRAEDDPKYGRK